MKKELLTLIGIFITLSCYSQGQILRKKPNNEKSAISFSEAKPSVIFFNSVEEGTAFKNHKLQAIAIYNYFGATYTSFPIFDIGSKNLVEYENSKGYFAFYRPNTKKLIGMVLSNGIDEPIIINNPDQYLKTLKKYLNIGNADYLVPKNFDATVKKKQQSEMMDMLDINSLINDNGYAKNLIKNANTSHYSIPYNDGSFIMHCKNRIYEMFSDSLMKNKSKYGAKYLYNSKNEMVSFINTIDGKETSFSKHERKENGLIEYIISGYKKNPDTTYFVYEKDKYHSISLKNGVPESFDTYFLNAQMQCVRRYSKSGDGVIRNVNYIYDKYGRIVREGDLENETIYRYKNDQDLFSSGFSLYKLNPRKLVLENDFIREKNKQTYIGKDGLGGLNFKSITLTDKDGATRTYSYDKNNKLTSVGKLNCAL